VPFGEIEAVRDWLGIAASVRQPSHVHPKRPVTGFDCPRSEVSGKRLWQLFARRFGGAPNFFASHFVMNYCPLAFLEESGCNRTPDKLPASEKRSLFVVCDRHLRDVVSALEPDWLIGIGGFAAKQAEAIFKGDHPQICRISHPSPANPAANRDWAGMATRQLQRLGVWQER
jgi:single-strand selective monofunctional uracil DNA glycosylase